MEAQGIQIALFGDLIFFFVWTLCLFIVATVVAGFVLLCILLQHNINLSCGRNKKTTTLKALQLFLLSQAQLPEKLL